MPARNRVTPTGEIVAIALRGRWMGNRGCLHRGSEIVKHSTTTRWICCETSFRGRRVQQWAPGRYTPLFFHDEAVALAVGHRPCFECRRPAARAFVDAWERAWGQRLSAKGMDAWLHAERGRAHDARWAKLPVGAFVVDDDGTPAVVLTDRIVSWTVEGYGSPRPRPADGIAHVLTPRAIVGVLAHGYVPQIDDAATAA